MSLDLIEEFDRVTLELEAATVDYALCGGLALAAHGHVRTTKDIDLLIRAEDVERALTVSRGVGFDVPARKITFGLRTGTPRDVHRVSKLEPDTGRLLTLDLLVVSSDLEHVWAGRTVVPWRNRTIVVVSRDGLATMKRLAGRPQDLADLYVLEGGNPDDDP